MCPDNTGRHLQYRQNVLFLPFGPSTRSNAWGERRAQRSAQRASHVPSPACLNASAGLPSESVGGRHRRLVAGDVVDGGSRSLSCRLSTWRRISGALFLLHSAVWWKSQGNLSACSSRETRREAASNGSRDDCGSVCCSASSAPQRDVCATVRWRRMIAAQGVSAPIGFVTDRSAVPLVRTALVSRGASCRGS